MKKPPASARLLLSVLIPTLPSRSEILSKLLEKLTYQVEDATKGAELDVEVVIREGNGGEAVGATRNALLGEAKGRFVSFVDDGDDISDDYIYQIRKALLSNPKVDCIGMRAIMTTNGKDPRPVVYSRKNLRPITHGGVYLRPPHPRTPVRRTIALSHKFPEVDSAEDVTWPPELHPEIKSELFVDKVLCHYELDPEGEASQAGARAPIASDNFRIIIPSARASNLIPCVKSILAMEPTMDPSRIVVVDDGAKADAEAQLPGVTWVSGEKPFCFARNVNLGLKECPGDAVIMNDDTELETKFGLTSMSYAVRAATKVGVCSAAITGVVGNRNQHPAAPFGLRQDPRMVAFICVYIPKGILAAVGELDERFVGYGFDDDDYCHRVTRARFRVMIYDGCVVYHNDMTEASTFRSKGAITELFNHNQALFTQKWAR